MTAHPEKFSNFQKFVISTVSRVMNTNLSQRMGKKIVLALQEVLYCTEKTYQDSSALLSSALVLPDADWLPQTLAGISAVLPAALFHRGTSRLVLGQDTFRQHGATVLSFSPNSEQLQNWRFKCVQRLGRSKPRSSTTRISEVRNPSQPKMNYVRESVSKCYLAHPIPPIQDFPISPSLWNIMQEHQNFMHHYLITAKSQTIENKLYVQTKSMFLP